MRRLIVFLLATFAFGSALAAPVSYEFRAFVGVRVTTTTAKLPAQLTPNTDVVGTLTLDPTRIVDGRIDPIVALRLTKTDGTVIFDTASRAVFSFVDTTSDNGIESVLIGGYTSTTAGAPVYVEFSWASPGQGQLPANPSQLNILTLQPYGWKFAIVNDDDRADAQIWDFKRAAASAEYEQNFGTAPNHWVNTAGNWTTQSGYYANAANVAFTSSVYTGQTLQPFAEVRADLYSGFTGSGNALGLVLNYQDASNFNEVRFTANGVVTINKVVNGVRTMLQTGSYSAAPKTFFHVSVLRDFDAIEVRVDNDPAIIAEDSTLTDGGRAGVFASWNRARVDNFAIDQLSPWGEAILHDFSSAEGETLEPQSGTWVFDNGVYRNTSNQAAAISVDTYPFFRDEFSISARINMQWSGSGNRGGLVYNFRNLQNYSAVLISPQTATRGGSVEVVDVVDGVRHVRLTTTDTQVKAGQWGEVSVSHIDGVTRIYVTGMLPGRNTFAQKMTGAQFGVIGSWNLVRFDDLEIRTQSGPLR